MKALNLVFAGTPAFGLPCLEALAQSQHSLKAVYTQPDRPSGRGRTIQASPIKSWALDHHLPVYQPLNFKAAETRSELAQLNPDLMIVIAYGLILPQAVLDIPSLGCINVHASLLPRWRGASPIQQAILAGDSETGVTLMQMDAGMDTGDMLAQVSCPIKPSDTAGDLHERLAALAVQPLLTLLDKLETPSLQPQAQDNHLVTYAAKITKEEACINWNSKAVDIERQIRAFNPWPIAYTHLKGERLRIHQAQVLELNEAALPGTILHLDKKGLLVATGQEGLLIQQIQLPGARVLAVADWLNSGKTQLYSGLVLQ